MTNFYEELIQKGIDNITPEQIKEDQEKERIGLLIQDKCLYNSNFSWDVVEELVKRLTPQELKEWEQIAEKIEPE